MFNVILGAIVPHRLFWNRLRMRWSLGADDIVFTTRRHQYFFSMGQIIPITRGDGVYQRPMDFALQQINQGGWVHIFPEGRHWPFDHLLMQFNFPFRKSELNQGADETEMGSVLDHVSSCS